jgi:DHA1 family bicyclomycin/chloramphenicol resistance-like MFS transporter
MKNINRTYLLIIVSTLSTIAPISIATYLPSMPSMAMDFGVEISQIELSLSIFMFGFAFGQIFGGPLSDKKGRKYSSLLGLFGFALFSLLISFCSSVYELWVFRFLQAFFGGLIVVNSTAIVRDRYEGLQAAKFFSLLGSIRSIVPMLAPALGSIILIFTTWEGIFLFLTFYASILFFLIYKDLDESYTYVEKKYIESYLSVLKTKNAMLMMFVLAFGFTSMFAIATKSSFIYMEYFKLSKNEFAFFYGVNFLFVSLFATLNVKLIKHFSQANILKTVLIIQILFAFIFTILNEDLNIYIASSLLAFYIGLNGLIFGNASSIIMEYFPKNAGVASAIIGVIQFGMASIISSIIVSFHGLSLLPIGIGMIAISFIGLLFLNVYLKNN